MSEDAEAIANRLRPPPLASYAAAVAWVRANTSIASNLMIGNVAWVLYERQAYPGNWEGKKP